jgi:GDP-D-mannose dehydratase
MKALIFGISGQDGVYLSQFLLNKGYKVFGTSRDTKENNLNWKDYVNVDNSLLRLSDIKISKGIPLKAKKILGRAATKNIDDIIKELCLSAKKFKQ